MVQLSFRTPAAIVAADTPVDDEIRWRKPPGRWR
jgi:hypothetical protein